MPPERGLVAITRRLARELAPLRFAAPVAHVYNPLDYAREPHERYLRRYGRQGIEVLLVGMNPGPWGMMQTGVPFGEVAAVRDWLGIEGAVERPPREHAARPITGFACTRSEVSGQRLWGWAKARFATPDAFFARCFVWNYCPLCFLEDSGRNRTPDKLPAGEREAMFAACDRALAAAIDWLGPRLVVGVGKFAEQRVQSLVQRGLLHVPVRVGTILHPSPASPLANQGWPEQVDRALRALGVQLDAPAAHERAANEEAR